MRMTLTEKFFFRFTLSFFLFLVRVYVAFIEWERMTCVFSLFFSFVSLTVRRRGDDCAPFRVRVRALPRRVPLRRRPTGGVRGAFQVRATDRETRVVSHSRLFSFVSRRGESGRQCVCVRVSLVILTTPLPPF